MKMKEESVKGFLHNHFDYMARELKKRENIQEQSLPLKRQLFAISLNQTVFKKEDDRD